MLDFYALITIAALTILQVVFISAIHYSSEAVKTIMNKKEKDYEFNF